MNVPGPVQGSVPPDAAGFDELAVVLREMAQRYGDTAFADRRRVLSLLQDRLPDARRNIKAVAAALDERVFDALARCRPAELVLEVERLSANLENGLGLRPDVAKPVVQACAFALGLGPLPSVEGGSGAAGWVGLSEPIARPAEPGWVGVTEPVVSAASSSLPPVPGSSSAAAPSVPGTASRLKRVAVWLVLAVVAGVGLLRMVHVEDEAPAPRPAVQPAMPPQQPPMPVQPQPQTPPQPQAPVQPQPQTPPAASQPQFFANEDQDFGVPPQSTLKQDVGSPTPTSIPGAHVVSTLQVYGELRQGHAMVLVDSLENSHPQTIQGAVYLPTSGRPGFFNDAVQAQLAQDLARLTGERRQIPLVFFCLGPQCWESYNAALRARAAGFPNVFWFRGGLQAWEAAGLPMQPLRH